MKRQLLPILLLVFSCLNGFAQDFTFDGHNCSTGSASEWGLPDHADNDTDGDGYGEQDTPTGTSDVLNLWFRANADYLYLAFERRKTGNSYFSFYLNTDCDANTGDPSNEGTDIAIAFDIRPGSDPMITNNLLYTWNGSEYQSTGKTFEAKVGMESCDGALGRFFELRIPIADIFEVCGNAAGCNSLTLNLASALAGGSPNSKLKDKFDFPVSFGVNSNPTAMISGPDQGCAGAEISFDVSMSTVFDQTRYTPENAPDFMDSIVSYEWDTDYDGVNFNTDQTGEQPALIFQGAGTRLIALRVTDAYGCTHISTHEITIDDAPEALFSYVQDDSCGTEVGVDAKDSKPSSQSTCVRYEWDFNYDGNFNVDATGITASHTYPGCGSYTIALRVTDDSQVCNTDQEIKTITINDTEAPEFTVPADLEILSDQDPNDLDLTGDVTDATDNCTVDAVSFSDETVSNPCGAKAITRTWTVTDLCGNSTEKVQEITVVSKTTTYSVQAPEDMEVSCAANYIPCIDFENLENGNTLQHAGRSIYISAGSSKGTREAVLFNSAAPSSADLDLGTPNEDFGGPGIGNAGNAGESNQNFIPRKNILIVQQPGATEPNDSNESGSYIDFDLSEFKGVTLGSISLLDIESKQDNRKIELFDQNNQLLATLDIPAMGDNGSATVDLRGTSEVYRIKVTLDGSGAITSLCFDNDSINAGTAVVNSDCGDDTPGIWYEDQAVYGTCGLEEIIRTWYTTDLAGNLYSDEQHISIIDTEAPVFNEQLPESMVTASCSDIPQAAILTATDACGGDTEVIFDETVSGSDSCGYTSEITRTWTATDCSGNAVTHTQVISVEDLEAPVFTSVLPTDITVECQDIPDAPTLSASDNCDVAVSIEMQEDITEGACAGERVIVRSWTASDCAGNSTSHTQTITVTDTTAPVLESDLSTDITVSCAGIPEVPELIFSDACGGTLAVNFSSSDDFEEDGQDYSIVRTWTATDACGNEMEVKQTIFVLYESETITLDGFSICVSDAGVNLNSYLPNGVYGTGTWQLAGDQSTTLENGLFDPSDFSTGNYEFEYKGNDGQCGVVYTIAISVNDDCVVLPCTSADDVVISKTVTPNGDAYNEYFTVKGVSEDCGFRITVKIYNRWGLLVYSSNDYQNDWNGYTNNSAVGSSGQVPAGTYYYIVDLVDSGLDTFTGYIYVGTGSN